MPAPLQVGNRWLVLTMIFASLSLNVVLLIVQFFPHSPHPGKEAIESKDTGKAAMVIGRRQPDMAPTLAEALALSGDITDYQRFAARLKDLGVSAEVTRAMIEGLIGYNFSQRRADIRFPPDLPFWKQTRGYNAEISARSMALRREEVALLKQILGPEAESDGSRIAKERSLYAKYGRIPMEKIALLEANRSISREQVLTTAELLEYEMHQGPDARRLANQLKDMVVTDDEFAAVYVAQKALDQLSRDAVRSSGPQENPEALRNEYFDRIRQTLGDMRFEAFLFASDPNYAQTAYLVNELKGQPDATFRIWQVRRAAEVEAQAGAGQWRRSVALNAEAQVSAILGPEGARAYLDRPAGAWLKALKQ